MTPDSKKSVSPNPVSDSAKIDLTLLLESGVADVSLRDLLGALLSPKLPSMKNAVVRNRIAKGRPSKDVGRVMRL